jgi:hypothetical protein
MACRVNRVVLALSLLFVSTACTSNAPPVGPEATCVKACETRPTGCKPLECRRGCNLILDRLAEGEGDNILACMGNTHGPCADRAWAHCAARVGAHADGGPAAPPPPPDVEDEEGM